MSHFAEQRLDVTVRDFVRSCAALYQALRNDTDLSLTDEILLDTCLGGVAEEWEAWRNRRQNNREARSEGATRPQARGGNPI